MTTGNERHTRLLAADMALREQSASLLDGHVAEAARDRLVMVEAA